MRSSSCVLWPSVTTARVCLKMNKSSQGSVRRSSCPTCILEVRNAVIDVTVFFISHFDSIMNRLLWSWLLSHRNKYSILISFPFVVVDCDEELFEDSWEQWVSQELEGADSETRRRAAVDFVRVLSRHFEARMTQVFGQYIQVSI